LRTFTADSALTQGYIGVNAIPDDNPQSGPMAQTESQAQRQTE
jgi:hypothetical protein